MKPLRGVSSNIYIYFLNKKFCISQRDSHMVKMLEDVKTHKITISGLKVLKGIASPSHEYIKEQTAVESCCREHP